MKVKELIEHLKNFDEELEVLIHDNKWGYTEACKPDYVESVAVSYPYTVKEDRKIDLAVIL
jgi:hypothetical protein